MNKNEIIKLAKEKGFISHFNKEWKYSSKEPLRQLFELTELQQWLRNIHNIEVSAQVNFFNKKEKLGYFYNIDKFDSNNIHDGKDYDMDQMYIIGDKKSFNTYELALQQGLLEALKLI